MFTITFLTTSSLFPTQDMFQRNEKLKFYEEERI